MNLNCETLTFCRCVQVLRYQTLTMSFRENLDRFRSTRTRIAKPTVPARTRTSILGSCSANLSYCSSSDKPLPPHRFSPLPGCETEPSLKGTGSKSRARETENGEELRDWSRYFGNMHPLRVVFVGHNPSEASWDEAAPYAHATNWFWRLVKESGLVPASLCSAEKHRMLPGEIGVGFIDLFVTSGSDASLVRKDTMRKRQKQDDEWRKEFLGRLRSGNGGVGPVVLACVSKVVAKKLLVGWGKEKGGYGFVGYGSEWELAGAEKSEVWVLPSTSGRAQLKRDERVAPFCQLAARLAKESPWKRTITGGEV